ncbi:hypothetical protein NDU88_000608 [Pleurodeles waltl]|uniref:Uncharacterized protein n=1 Tax=Pleurodeles waltl TaxID=8319 RepID=A0AAV7V5K5_PLEWA|nr:hypothetical protein NDU88_000608 [Pleurodeles waltl]
MAPPTAFESRGGDRTWAARSRESDGSTRAPARARLRGQHPSRAPDDSAPRDRSCPGCPRASSHSRQRARGSRAPVSDGGGGTRAEGGLAGPGAHGVSQRAGGGVGVMLPRITPVAPEESVWGAKSIVSKITPSVRDAGG